MSMNTPHTHNPPRAGLWARLRAAWATLLGRPAAHTAAPQHAHAELVDTAPSPLEPTSQPSAHTQRRDVQPYNPQALPAAREQWQRGDWASLAALTLEYLQDHPDRAKLALLAAAGHMQLGRQDLGADCLRQAKAWGCSPQLMRQVVIAGVHNTLGRASTLAGFKDRGEIHHDIAARIAIPYRETKAERYRSLIKND